VLEHVHPAVVILKPTDELTVDTETDLKDAVRRQLDAGRVHLVLDLTHVPYIDSCGLGRIAQAHVSACRLGGELKLLNVNPRNRQLLTITRLIGVLELYQPDRSPVGV
jgi:anti-anti-sigma factor